MTNIITLRDGRTIPAATAVTSYGTHIYWLTSDGVGCLPFNQVARIDRS